MNALVMNFFVTEGYAEAARCFARETSAEPGVDLDSLQDRVSIRRAVHSGQIDDAIDKTNDLNSEILEEDSSLFFRLQQQKRVFFSRSALFLQGSRLRPHCGVSPAPSGRFIELIRAGKTEEALEFAQDNLAPRGEENPDFLDELERRAQLLPSICTRIRALGCQTLRRIAPQDGHAARIRGPGRAAEPAGRPARPRPSAADGLAAQHGHPGAAGARGRVAADGPAQDADVGAAAARGTGQLPSHQVRHPCLSCPPPRGRAQRCHQCTEHAPLFPRLSGISRGAHQRRRLRQPTELPSPQEDRGPTPRGPWGSYCRAARVEI